MAYFNNTVVVGRLVRDVEKITFQSGTSKVYGTLACNKQFKTSEGESKEKTLFIDFFTFGPMGEILEKYTSKGRTLLLSGELENNKWEDKDGNKREKVVLKVNDFQFLDGPSDKQEKPEKENVKQAKTPKSKETEEKTKEPIPF